MFKVTMDLGRVNKYLKMKFGLIIQSDQQLPLINKFNMNGNDYLKISPMPILTLEIKSNADKKEEWNPNRSINLSRVTNFLFYNRLVDIIRKFKQKKDLFYYEGDQLKLNRKVASSLKEVVRVGSKVCVFQPIVINDEDSQDQFEGIVLMINSVENYCFITFEEMEYLANYLHTIDMDNLSLQLINTTVLCKGMKTEQIERPKKVITEEKDDQASKYTPTISKKTLPDI